MGASPYLYYVPYEPNTQAALDKLREREFRAGRYNPVMPFPPCPVDANSPAPGAQHDSIEEAFEDADADGTRSILDLDHVATEPYDPENEDYGSVAPLPEEVLEEFFGTTQPTRAQMEEVVWDLFEELERGMGVYSVLYKNGRPDEILFAGYSFD